MADLNLVVLYSSQPQVIRDFYAALLGNGGVEERHKDGPTHYSWTLDNLVLEVYPARRLGKELNAFREAPEAGVALGINVSDLEAALSDPKVQECLYQQPQQRDCGKVALLHDPDGRKVILVEKLVEKNK